MKDMAVPLVTHHWAVQKAANIDLCVTQAPTLTATPVTVRMARRLPPAARTFHILPHARRDILTVSGPALRRRRPTGEVVAQTAFELFPKEQKT